MILTRTGYTILRVLLDEIAGNWQRFNIDHFFPGKELKIVFAPNDRLKQLFRDLYIKYNVI